MQKVVYLREKCRRVKRVSLSCHLGCSGIYALICDSYTPGNLVMIAEEALVSPGKGVYFSSFVPHA